MMQPDIQPDVCAGLTRTVQRRRISVAAADAFAFSTARTSSPRTTPDERNPAAMREAQPPAACDVQDAKDECRRRSTPAGIWRHSATAPRCDFTFAAALKNLQHERYKRRDGIGGRVLARIEGLGSLKNATNDAGASALIRASLIQQFHFHVEAPGVLLQPRAFRAASTSP